MASNLKGTKWQHRDLNSDHLTPPEPLLLATLLHVCGLDGVNLDVCVLVTTQRGREPTRHFQTKVLPRSLFSRAVMAEHTCTSGSLGGFCWNLCTRPHSQDFRFFENRCPCGDCAAAGLAMTLENHIPRACLPESAQVSQTELPKAGSLHLHDARFRTCKRPAYVLSTPEDLEQVTYL